MGTYYLKKWFWCGFVRRKSCHEYDVWHCCEMRFSYWIHFLLKRELIRRNTTIFWRIYYMFLLPQMVYIHLVFPMPTLFSFFFFSFLSTEYSLHQALYPKTVTSLLNFRLYATFLKYCIYYKSYCVRLKAIIFWVLLLICVAKDIS